jgi:DNA-binding NtrC family response regulator
MMVLRADWRRVTTRQVVTATPPAAAVPALLGDSPVMTRLRAEIARAARADAKVLVTGETGSGKEIVAELIHRQGARRDRPFVAVNCAGLSDTLLESELFGHVRGSFTDAYRDKAGLAERADGGTLFLDELGEMSPRMQGILLRFVESGEIHRVGSGQPDHRVDVRIVAATNRNLAERMGTGEFREDLFYRLNVIPIVVPPLRERGRDVLQLFFHFLARACRADGVPVPALTPAVEDRLLAYSWPGNVREVRNVAERMAAREHDGTIEADMLPAEIIDAGRPRVSAKTSLLAAASPAECHPEVDDAWKEMVVKGRSFWAVVHPRFMDRELTKTDVREIVRRALEKNDGSYRKVLAFFHMPAADYKRFTAFLSQHDCHVGPPASTL